MTSPPVPEIVPLKVVEAPARLRFWEPSVTVPEPEREAKVTDPPVVAEISNIPLSEIVLDVARPPVLDKLNVPAAIVVMPV